MNYELRITNYELSHKNSLHPLLPLRGCNNFKRL